MSWIHENPSNTTDKQPFEWFSVDHSFTLAVVAYVMIIIVSQNMFAFHSWTHILTTIVLVFTSSSRAQRKEKHPPSPAMALLIVASDEDGVGEMNLMQAVGIVNFWLLFLAMVFGMGSGRGLSTI